MFNYDEMQDNYNKQGSDDELFKSLTPDHTQTKPSGMAGGVGVASAGVPKSLIV